jgi:hypothetical protein
MSSARTRLVDALRSLPDEHREHLRTKKEKALRLRKRPDLCWFLLLQSAATLGSSRGAEGLIQNPAVMRTVSYEALRNMSARKREGTILNALRSAKVRMQTLKAPQLARNWAKIESMGGVRKVSRTMLALPSRAEKIKFAKSFHGIGQKYGRNVWMDIYDDDFRDSIAIDVRLKRIARSIGFNGTRYCESEDMFRDLARDAGLDAWELDRLLYGFTDHYEMAAGGPT